jgi:hypothetical protein
MNINTIHNSYSPAIVQPGSVHNVKAQDKTEPENKNTASQKQEISSKFVDEHKDELTKNEKIILVELKQVDQAVKKHEMAHVIAGGRFILSGANYSYKTGPDGKRYAVAGEVSIDTSEVPGDPQATIDKMNQVRRAALAPADPSAQDRKIASTAMTISTKAMSQLMLDRIKNKADSDEEKAFGNIKQTAENAYLKVQDIPDNQQESTFKVTA